jgi:DNA-binding MarR family transcriptional regulator
VTVALTHRGPLLLVYALSQQTQRLLDEHIDMSRMAGGAFAVYSVVGAEEPVTPSRLAEILGMPPTSLSYVIKRMHEAGHLKRVRNPDDGRSVLLRLTARGRRVLDDALVGFRKAITAFRAELDVDEPVLLQHLEAMSAALSRTTTAQERPPASAALLPRPAGAGSRAPRPTG